ncbi:hypothetical protein ACWCPQ_15715 [Nocardia sp. NPDC001965]
MPAFRLSDGPADHHLWRRLLTEHDRTGFWPLLLAAGNDDAPWVTGDAS